MSIKAIGPMGTPVSEALKWTSVFGLWLVAVFLGFAFLVDHECRPGEQALAPETWPPGLALMAEDQPTLIMAVHPQCPCTRASLGELEKLMTRFDKRLQCRVLLFEPNPRPAHWDETNLKDLAGSIPGVEVQMDPNGELAEAFGVKTSGQVLLYGVEGNLLFAGGVTASRGHAGESQGSQSLEEIVLGTRGVKVTQAPVYGCEISREEELACQKSK